MANVKQVKKVSGLILFVMAFAGCAAFDQTILVPEQNGVYHVIALDSTDFGAQRSALKRAEKTCSGRDNMRHVVDAQQTYYLGTASSSGPLSAGNNGSSAQQTIPNKKTAEDYKSVVTFHCVIV
jgi:hypothetical protein